MFFKFTPIVLLLQVILLCGACSSDDPGEPNTAKNRAKIQKYLHLEPDPKITDICFCDAIDLKKRGYYFAFTAPREVIDRILKKHSFRKEKPNHDADYLYPRDLSWWDARIREKSEYYYWREYEGEYLRTHYQVWYHPETGKCQIALNYSYIPQKGWLKYYRFHKYDANE